MAAPNPEDLDRLFAEALNAGDLEALTRLYEPHATIRPVPGGEAVHGLAAIRAALAGFIGMKPTMTMTTRTLGQAGGLALTTARWELTGTDQHGRLITMNGHSVEVARQQPDGNWLFVIDTPWGLGWE
jgi:ketosteroid isomerase-like protein